MTTESHQCWQAMWFTDFYVIVNKMCVSLITFYIYFVLGYMWIIF